MKTINSYPSIRIKKRLIELLDKNKRNGEFIPVGDENYFTIIAILEYLDHQEYERRHPIRILVKRLLVFTLVYITRIQNILLKITK